MKYKTLAAAAVTIFTTMTADVNAACKCDVWFNGSQKCDEYSKLNPNYWACRTLFLTISTLCKGTICLGSPNSYDAKQAKNEQACAKNGNEAACKAELETDVTNFTGDVETTAQQIQATLDKEAAAEAECYEKTGKSCDGK